MNHLKPAHLAFAGLFAVLAAAVPASAALGLPIGLPSVGQHIDTPLGPVDADASENGASACADLATPALPALPAVPSLPLPVPVAVPAVPAVGAATQDCASAGLDGAHAQVGAQAAGLSASTGADVDTSPAHQAVDGATQTASESSGFFQGLLDSIMSWF
jgi:hypothetical protein